MNGLVGLAMYTLPHWASNNYFYLLKCTILLVTMSSAVGSGDVHDLGQFDLIWAKLKSCFPKNIRSPIGMSKPMK